MASYQKCCSIVLGGHVTVNGIPERHPQRMINIGRDKILVKGRLVEPARDHLYVVVHKPAGVLSSMRPVGDESMASLQTLLQRLTSESFTESTDNILHLLWRLGMRSSGLQLLTSDKNWASEAMANSHGRHRSTSLMLAPLRTCICFAELVMNSCVAHNPTFCCSPMHTYMYYPPPPSLLPLPITRVMRG